MYIAIAGYACDINFSLNVWYEEAVKLSENSSTIAKIFLIKKLNDTDYLAFFDSLYANSNFNGDDAVSCKIWDGRNEKGSIEILPWKIMFEEL